MVVPAHKVLPQLPVGALARLVGDGLAHTLGAVVYARAWLDPWPGRFGHHETWHLFVLAGAGALYAFTYALVDLPYAPF